MVFSSTTRGATPSWPFRIGAARWADQRRTREARRSPCTASFQRETSRLSQHSVAARLDDSNHLFRTFRHGAQGAYSRAFGDSQVRIASPLARSVIAVCVTEFLTVAVHALDKAGARFGDVRREGVGLRPGGVGGGGRGGGGGASRRRDREGGCPRRRAEDRVAGDALPAQDDPPEGEGRAQRRVGRGRSEERRV